MKKAKGYHPFSKESYDRNNMPVIVAAISFLTQYDELFKDPIIPEKEMYKAGDFAITFIPQNRQILVEVEGKRGWDKNGCWQGFPTVDVPYRKKNSNAHLYIMANRWRDTIAVMSMEELKKAPVSEKNTKSTINEKFFNVPIEWFNFFVYKDGKWEMCDA